MYQPTCKISSDENQIVTNEWTIIVNSIGLTNFQEISGNGKRSKSVKQADAASEEDAAANLIDRKKSANEVKELNFSYQIK